MKNELLIKQVDAIIKDNIPQVSNLANVSSLLFTLENLNWAGFYLTIDNTLYLGPFQGEVACTMISYNKGVCGTALALKQTLVVDNVNEFKGHIACSSLSKSEIVVPIIKEEKVVAVIDIDSPIYNRFTSDDKETLEEIANILARRVF